MSFLTLFTADAAAAHGHEFSTANGNGMGVSASSLRRSASMGKDGGINRLSTISSNVSTIFEHQMPSPPPPATLKKSPRTKTSYHLAQPPPSAHLLLHRSSPSRNLVVQLQRLSNTTRPVPTLDVLPASVFASRLKATCGRFFKHGVGSQDLVFLTSEEYGDEQDEQDDDDSGLNSRQVVATVSQNYKKGSAEDGKGAPRIPAIRLASGPAWEVTQTTSGGYEFSAHQADGSVLVARWNPRTQTGSTRRRSHQTSDAADPNERRFQFSLVDPNSHRHPIIATLVRQTIEINDHYPAANTASPAPSPTHSRSSSPINGGTSEERLYVETSNYMRILILASGIWVALREGLAASSLHMDDPAPLSPTIGPNPNGRRSPTRPAASVRSSSCPVSLDPPMAAADDPPRTRLMRAGTLRAHQATTNTPQRTLSTGPRPGSGASSPSRSPIPSPTKSGCILPRRTSRLSRRDKDGLEPTPEEVLKNWKKSDKKRGRIRGWVEMLRRVGGRE